jgi:hypothetical protein
MSDDTQLNSPPTSRIPSTVIYRCRLACPVGFRALKLNNTPVFYKSAWLRKASLDRAGRIDLKANQSSIPLSHRVSER